MYVLAASAFSTLHIGNERRISRIPSTMVLCWKVTRITMGMNRQLFLRAHENYRVYSITVLSCGLSDVLS